MLRCAHVSQEDHKKGAKTFFLRETMRAAGRFGDDGAALFDIVALFSRDLSVCCSPFEDASSPVRGKV